MPPNTIKSHNATKTRLKGNKVNFEQIFDVRIK